MQIPIVLPQMEGMPVAFGGTPVATPGQPQGLFALFLAQEIAPELAKAQGQPVVVMPDGSMVIGLGNTPVPEGAVVVNPPVNVGSPMPSQTAGDQEDSESTADVAVGADALVFVESLAGVAAPVVADTQVVGVEQQAETAGETVVSEPSAVAEGGVAKTMVDGSVVVAGQTAGPRQSSATHRIVSRFNSETVDAAQAVPQGPVATSAPAGSAAHEAVAVEAVVPKPAAVARVSGGDAKPETLPAPHAEVVTAPAVTQPVAAGVVPIEATRSDIPEPALIPGKPIAATEAVAESSKVTAAAPEPMAMAVAGEVAVQDQGEALDIEPVEKPVAAADAETDSEPDLAAASEDSPDVQPETTAEAGRKPGEKGREAGPAQAKPLVHGESAVSTEASRKVQGEQRLSEAAQRMVSRDPRVAGIQPEAQPLGQEAHAAQRPHGESSDLHALIGESRPVAVSQVREETAGKAVSDSRWNPANERATVETLGNAAVKSVRYLVDNDEKRLQIRLEPPSLGKLQVEVVSSKDALHVRLISADPAVRVVLESQSDSLRNALARDGVDVVKLTVAADAGSQQGSDGAAGRQQSGMPGAPRPSYHPASWHQNREAVHEASHVRAGPQAGLLNLYA